jgi:hypothetical protein
VDIAICVSVEVGGLVCVAVNVGEAGIGVTVSVGAGVAEDVGAGVDFWGLSSSVSEIVGVGERGGISNWHETSIKMTGNKTRYRGSNRIDDLDFYFAWWFLFPS